MPLLILLLIAWCAGSLKADDTNDITPIRISAAAASQHYGQLVTVSGKVAQVTIRPSIVFINLDQPYPDSPMAAIIFPSATNRFDNLKRLRGRAVEITGTVKEYHNKPEIILQKPAQLTVEGRPYTNLHTPAAMPPTATPKTPASTNASDDVM